jgi:ribonuclease P protein component
LKRLGLSKNALIRKGGEFERVYSQGRRLHGKGFSLIWCANAEGRKRIGISVHGKIRGAVKRNRIKRIIRESFRLQQEYYPEAADVVFAVRPDFSLASPADIGRSVALLTRRSAGQEV